MFNLMAWLFGCTHKRFTFPMTPRRGQPRPAAAAATGMYVVCLDCGKEFAYDWQQMKTVLSAKNRNTALRPSHAPAKAV
jgi:hypothetical protein